MPKTVRQEPGSGRPSGVSPVPPCGSVLPFFQYLLGQALGQMSAFYLTCTKLHSIEQCRTLIPGFARQGEPGAHIEFPLMLGQQAFSASPYLPRPSFSFLLLTSPTCHCQSPRHSQCLTVQVFCNSGWVLPSYVCCQLSHKFKMMLSAFYANFI